MLLDSGQDADVCLNLVVSCCFFKSVRICHWSLSSSGKRPLSNVAMLGRIMAHLTCPCPNPRTCEFDMAKGIWKSNSGYRS